MADPISTPSTGPTASVIESLKQVVGAQGWSTDEAERRSHATDWIGRFFVDPLLVLKPSTTFEVSEIARICNDNGLKVVPQGGNTSLACGSIPTGQGDEVIVNLSRLNRIRNIDMFNDTISVDAGCTLASVQQAAEEADRLFPLKLGSEGSCQIGGNIATNAGGTNVLRYGNMRDLVLGLEVVLADGRILDGMRALRKDNTGYDLKHLFIGSEGTLGIVTGAVLKLFPMPSTAVAAVCTVPSLQSALDLLVLCKKHGGESLTTFELMPRAGLELVFKHFPSTRFPLGELQDWQLLIEFRSNDGEERVRELFETILSQAFEAETVIDAAIAQSIQQNRDFWALREGLAEADFMEGAVITTDISLPLSAVPAFMDACSRAVLAIVPKGRVVAFGHLGDGNIHFGLLQPLGSDSEQFLSRSNEIQSIIHTIALSMQGSMSAEHGLGFVKNDAVAQYRSQVEHDLMLTMKAALDPKSTLNAGKVLTIENGALSACNT